MTVVSHNRQVAGAMPPPPAPPANTPILIVVSRLTPAPPEPPGEATSGKLPKTGSMVPLIGFLGILFLSTSLALTMVRRLRSAA